MIIKDFSISDFKFWAGAVSTWKTVQENDKEEELEQLIEELYPNGLTQTELNDLLWFESDFIIANLGIEEDEEV